MHAGSRAAALSKSSLPKSQIKLWNPDSHDAGDEFRTLTLRRCFEDYLLPSLADREPATAKQLRYTVARWEELTDNPPVAGLSDVQLLAFRNARSAQDGGMAESTVNKDLRNVREILRFVGPHTDGNPRGLGILPLLPYCEMLAIDDPAKRIATDAELSALYQACDVAAWPARGVSAPRLWRALVVCFYNWGVRTRDLFRLPPEAIAPGDRTPGRSLPDRRYLTFVPKKTARRKPQPLRLPLNETVALHIDAIAGDRERLFPFPPGNVRDLQRTWNLIHCEAGIPLERKVQFRDIRKTCNTRFDEVSPGIGEWILGHAPRDVNKKYYLGVERRILEAVDHLPQPAGFRRIEPQLRLF